MRHREILGNWLICAVLNHTNNTEAFIFTEDPMQGGDGDGSILDLRSGIAKKTEHVFVTHERCLNAESIEVAVVEEIQRKQSKGGASYAQGMNLVVLVDTKGEMSPDAIRLAVQGKTDFSSIWIIAFVGCSPNQAYEYMVIETSQGQIGRCKIDIDFKRDSWVVKQMH